VRESQLIKEWQAESEARGRVQGAAEMLLRFLEVRFGPVPPALREQIEATQDRARIDAWVPLVFAAANLADFAQRISSPANGA
jgi:hypothetical protein